MAIQIRRLSYGLGAEISGFDMTRDIDADIIGEIRQAWLDHQILLIRGQKITPAQHIRFTSYFGSQEEYPLKHYRHPDHAEIFLLTNMDDAGNITQTADAAREWHTDFSWSVKPALGSILRCLQVPDYGGTTAFSNMYMAYERLSPAYRRMLDELYAIHEVFSAKTANSSFKNSESDSDRLKRAEMARENPPVIQPVVRIHPETGRKALYVCEGVTTRLVGFTHDESEPILKFIQAWAARIEYTYRHTWQVDDIIMWDNRCTLHMAVPDNDHQQRRLMHRTTILGTGSGEYAPADDTFWYDEKERRVRAGSETRQMTPA